MVSLICKTYSLGDTLSNDGNGADLRALHELHGGAVDGTGRGEVDNGVNVRVLGHGLGDILVDGEKSLAGTPVPVIASVSQFRRWDLVCRTSCSRTGHRRCR